MKATPHATQSSAPKSTDTAAAPLRRFWQPRYWHLWVALAALRLMLLLPFRAQLRIGGLLGKLLFTIAPKRRRIAEVNLRICFPELDETALRKLVDAHGKSLGFSIFEIGLALWGSPARIEKLVTLEGVENLTKPLAEGKGVIILSGHFPAVELIGSIVSKHASNISAMYRPLKNPMIDQLLRNARQKAVWSVIAKDDVRLMIRRLRKGMPIWYASDQSYHRSNAELVKFFTEPAMTNPALTDIARVGKACVVPYVPRRLADGSGYHAAFLPALENFPTDDPAADAERVNSLLAEWIRKAPEQYYWVHRRFKNRPEPWPDPYKDI